MREKILDNLDQYSAEQLFNFIRQGIITLDDLCEEGLPVDIRHKIEELLDKDYEEEDWQHACNLNSVEAYQKYLDKYPTGKHRSDARNKMNSLPPARSNSRQGDDDSVYSQVDKNCINALEEFIRDNPQNQYRFDARRRINKLKQKNKLSGLDRIRRVVLQSDPGEIPAKIENLILRQEASEGDLIELFRNDHNVLPVEVVKRLNGILDFSSLREAGIDEAFIEELNNPASLNSSELDTDVNPLAQIPDGFTEIYFWGVPASGKTCAVGAIMSAMTKGQGVKFAIPYEDSQGKDYMQPLAASFREDSVCVLPPRTKVEETFEMRYLITDDDNKEHNVAFIDLSGELFECISKSNSRNKLTPKQQQALDVLEDILVNNRSQNPKIHFFVIEYGSETRTYKGVTQNDLLLSCLSYLDEKSILKENTIGAYLIITKADKAGNADIGDYIDQHYSGFYNGLTERMTKWGINTRKGKSQVKRFPFSIGDVCFQKWCLHDREWTQYIIDEIKNRSYGIETGISGIIKSIIRK